MTPSPAHHGQAIAFLGGIPTPPGAVVIATPSERDAAGAFCGSGAKGLSHWRAPDASGRRLRRTPLCRCTLAFRSRDGYAN
jgi:hypothetical protein